MSCQKVLSLLSSYLDGEVQGADAEYVGRHLAECESCARELDMLRRVAGMLREHAEVEPPASLLEQIEAATIGRPGILERLRTGFAGIPRYAQVAGAGLAAAAVLIVLLLAQPKDDGTVRRPSGKPTQPPVVVITPTPTQSPEIKPSAKPDRTVTVAERQRRRTRPTLAASNARPVHPAPKQVGSDGATSPASPPSEEVNEPLPTSEDALANEPETATAAETEPAPGEAVAAEPPKEQPVEKKPETVAKKTGPQEDPSTMDQLRAKLAAKNKQKQKYEVKEEPVAGKKHSVPLVGFRF